MFFFVALFAISSYIRFSTDSFEQVEQIKTYVKNPTSITFDSTGSVHINTSNHVDLAFSLGVIHAERRNWELFINQQIASGKLGKYFGEQWLETDALISALDIDLRAQEIYNGLSEPHKTLLSSYVAGINAHFNRNKRSLNIRFASYDLIPTAWHAYTPISLWLVELILDNPAITQDALIVALGIELSTSEREALFQALPRTTVFEAPSIIDKDELHAQLLDIHKYWLDLSIKSGIKSMDAGNFTVAQSTNNGFSSLITSKIEPLDGFSQFIATEIELSGNNIQALSQVGSPIFWLKNSVQNAQKVTINRGGDGFHSLNLLVIDSTNQQRLNPKAIVLEANRNEPTLREFTFLDKKHLVFSQSEPNNRTSIALVLAERYSLQELVRSYGSLLDITYSEESIKMDNLAFYEITSIESDAGITFYEEAEESTAYDYKGLTNLTSSNFIHNRSFSSNSNFNGFIISHGNMFIQNEQRYFRDWRNDFFSLEYLQTELLVDQQPSKDKLIALLSSNYSSYAAKTLIDVEDVLSKNTLSEDITVANAYFENWNFLFDENAAAATIFEYFNEKLIESIFSDELTPELFELLKQQKTLFPVLTLFALNNSLSILDNSQSAEKETKEDIILESLAQAMTNVKREFGNQTEDWRWGNYLARTRPVEKSARSAEQASSYFDLMLYPISKEIKVFNEGHWSTPNRVSFLKSFENRQNQILNNAIQMMFVGEKAYFLNTNKNYLSPINTANSTNWKELTNSATIRSINLLPTNK